MFSKQFKTGMTFSATLFMEEKNYTGIVPDQQTGKAIDAERKHERVRTPGHYEQRPGCAPIMRK